MYLFLFLTLKNDGLWPPQSFKLLPRLDRFSLSWLKCSWFFSSPFEIVAFTFVILYTFFELLIFSLLVQGYSCRLVWFYPNYFSSIIKCLYTLFVSSIYLRVHSIIHYILLDICMQISLYFKWYVLLNAYT